MALNYDSRALLGVLYNTLEIDKADPETKAIFEEYAVLHGPQAMRWLQERGLGTDAKSIEENRKELVDYMRANYNLDQLAAIEQQQTSQKRRDRVAIVMVVFGLVLVGFSVYYFNKRK